VNERNVEIHQIGESEFYRMGGNKTT